MEPGKPIRELEWLWQSGQYTPLVEGVDQWGTSGGPTLSGTPRRTLLRSSAGSPHRHWRAMESGSVALLFEGSTVHLWA
jgi:hypothetical protein